MNIYEKLSAVSTELSAVAKNLEVGFGQNKYKATGEADILAAIKPLEAKHKIYSYPYAREIIETGEIETKTGTKNLFLRIATTYRFINIEKPEEYVDITSYGDGVDSSDKSVGKAMTYCDKYALMKAYKIITGEDPDQYASEEMKSSKTQKTEPNRKNKTVETKKTEKLYPITDRQIKEFTDYWGEDLLKEKMKKYGVTDPHDLPQDFYAMAYKEMSDRIMKENEKLSKELYG